MSQDGTLGAWNAAELYLNPSVARREELCICEVVVRLCHGQSSSSDVLARFKSGLMLQGVQRNQGSANGNASSQQHSSEEGEDADADDSSKATSLNPSATDLTGLEKTENGHAHDSVQVTRFSPEEIRVCNSGVP